MKRERGIGEMKIERRGRGERKIERGEGRGVESGIGERKRERGIRERKIERGG